MGEEDLLGKPGCRVPFSQATGFGLPLQPSWRNRVLWFFLLCSTGDQAMCGFEKFSFPISLFKVSSRISSELSGG